MRETLALEIRCYGRNIRNTVDALIGLTKIVPLPFDLVFLGFGQRPPEYVARRFWNELTAACTGGCRALSIRYLAHQSVVFRGMGRVLAGAVLRVPVVHGHWLGRVGCMLRFGMTAGTLIQVILNLTPGHRFEIRVRGGGSGSTGMVARRDIGVTTSVFALYQNVG